MSRGGTSLLFTVLHDDPMTCFYVGSLTDNSMSQKLIFEKLHPNASLPFYGSKYAACFDVRACLDVPVAIAPGDRVALSTGLKCDIPAMYELLLRPRSGLAIRNGISLVNTPATLDEDYTGEIMVILINHGEETFIVHHGDRIAQGSIHPVTRVDIVEGVVDKQTARGDGKFGSTGLS